LHKIYFFPAQGKGAGRLLIDAVVAYAKENHSKTLSLNVNRFNKAVFYEN
jgi:GNAT superfamily N-acetyltransferase